MIKLTLNWRLTLFAGIFLPVLLGLGFWQLSRADEKRNIIEAWQAQQLDQPVLVDDLAQHEFVQHQKAELIASFAPERYWLLEARIINGQPGYEVLTPAYLENRQWLLVNRGWVKADPDRRVLPQIETSEIKQRLWGELRKPSHTALIDEKNNPVSIWPHRVLETDINTMSDQIGQKLAPFVLNLASDHPSAFIVQSKLINMPPTKHEAYAVQWFSLAFALLVLWLLTNTNIVQLFKNN